MTPRDLATGVWRDLPFWFLWLGPFAMLDLARNQLGGELQPALWAFALPFAVVTRVRAALFPERRWGGYALASAAVLLAVLAGWTGPALPREHLLRVFEAMALAEFAVLALHAGIFGGRRVLAALFGVGALYGLILENGGVVMGFFEEPGYAFYLPWLPAPVATALGWCVVFYPLWFCVRRLSPGASPMMRAALATAMALAIDLQLDPLATEARFWIWNSDLPPAVRGVPLINFIAWASAVLPFAWAVFRDEDPAAGPSPKALLRRLPAVLAMALVMVLVLSAILEIRAGWPALAQFARFVRGG